MAAMDKLVKLMQLQKMMDDSAYRKKKYNYDMEQDRIRNENKDRTYTLQKLVSDRAQKAAQKKLEKDAAKANALSVAGTNIPQLIKAYKNDPTGYAEEIGAMESDYAGDLPANFTKDKMQQYYNMYGKPGSDSKYSSLIRAYGSEAPFIIQTYGDGKLPETTEEFNAMTQEAKADPKYGEKRTEWQNHRIANTLKSSGVSAEDPNKNVYTDRFGKQVLIDNKGDTIAQQLKNPTTEEINKLDAYHNTYNEINRIGEVMNKAFTGPLQGNWANVKSKLVGTPEFQAFKSRVEKLRTIIYGLSGKAINETEQAWLDTILPKIAMPDENFQANLDELKQWVEDRQRSYILSLKDGRRYVGTKPLGEGEGVPEDGGGGEEEEKPKRVLIKL